MLQRSEESIELGEVRAVDDHLLLYSFHDGGEALLEVNRWCENQRNLGYGQTELETPQEDALQP